MNSAMTFDSKPNQSTVTNAELISELKAFGSIKKIIKGTYIYHADQRLNEIYVVINGQVKIEEMTKNEKLITTKMVYKGDIFGITQYNTNTVSKESAITTVDSEILIIKHHIVNDKIINNSTLTLILTDLIYSYLQKTEQTLNRTIHKSSKARIADFIVRLAEDKGQKIGYEWLIKPFMTHNDIAGITGTSRQTVTTVLNELRNENLLIFDRQRLLVRDIDCIRSIAS